MKGDEKYERIMADPSKSPIQKMQALFEEYEKEVIAEHGEAEWDRRVKAALARKVEK